MPRPVRVAVLETPAGFQPNSALVAQKVGDFLCHHLQNYQPEVAIVPARRRGTDFSPDNPDIVAPIQQANVIFMGPGSPTYAVRQLQGSLAWHTVLARHRLGAALILASAATIAASAYALPVYEIFKSGEDLHWHPGLDLFGPYGLSLVFISHWNNQEGGDELDTSRCYMGRSRFEGLLDILPSKATVIGIDEHTALIVNIAEEICHVMGRGSVAILRRGEEQRTFHTGTLGLAALGDFQMVGPETGIPPDLSERVLLAQEHISTEITPEPPPEVLLLVQMREAARAHHNWAAADDLRNRIAELGWQINDTKAGPQWLPIKGK
ncbi:MAG: hypothetical protein HYX82_05515 [Chloroflexi bacterium]|nr:hypothetical protein [Chloroflexota bacterium]